jgi:hypothetical protein
MSQPFPTPSKLRPGQTLICYAESGSALHIANGEVELTRWLWLGEQLHEQTIQLRAGEHHAIDEPGWTRLYTRHGAELNATAPASGAARHLQELWAWLLSLRRLLPLGGRGTSSRPIQTTSHSEVP